MLSVGGDNSAQHTHRPCLLVVQDLALHCMLAVFARCVVCSSRAVVQSMKPGECSRISGVGLGSLLCFGMPADSPAETAVGTNTEHMLMCMQQVWLQPIYM
jgi:hypothetical protein